MFQSGSVPFNTDAIPLSSMSTSSIDSEDISPQKPSSFSRVPSQSRWQSFTSPVRQFVDNNTGLLLVACSQLFSSCMGVIVKKLNSLDPPVHPLELVWVRMIITWSCCVAYMKYMDIPDAVLGPKGIRLLLVFRGFCGFFSLFGNYFSLQYLSLSDSTVLQFLAPMCTAIVAAIVLKEEFKRGQAVASLCCLFGVILIARPQFIFGDTSRNAPPLGDVTEGVIPGPNMPVPATPAQRLSAVIAALISVAGATCVYTTIRAIGKRAHPLHNLTAFSSQCVVASTVLLFTFQVPIVFPTSLVFVLALLAIGFLGFMGQILMTMGVQREAAGRATMAIYIQIIFATINDIVFFNTTPGVLSIVGTVIIMTSAIYVALSKHSGGGSADDPKSSSPEEAALEEGLLANQDEDEERKDDELRVDIKGIVTQGSPRSL